MAGASPRPTAGSPGPAPPNQIIGKIYYIIIILYYNNVNIFYGGGVSTSHSRIARSCPAGPDIIYIHIII